MAVVGIFDICYDATIKAYGPTVSMLRQAGKDFPHLNKLFLHDCNPTECALLPLFVIC